MDATQLGQLLQERWTEAVTRFPYLSTLNPGWTFGESPHFAIPRGYATTVIDGQVIYLKLASKILEAPMSRVDAIVRHEIGHMVDYSGLADLPETLPTTPERRADAIAELIWGEPIRYDTEFVQTLGDGVTPRPDHLGL